MAKEKLRILSSTLAEIYVRQGHFGKAREIYEKLLSKDCGNSFYSSRLVLLSQDSPGIRRLRVLSVLLNKIEEKLDERETST
jgi:pentatricopeptide repeat protein